jgi:integrase
MTKQINMLTHPLITSWLRAGKKIQKSDGQGLTFTLSEAGCATWVLRYRANGKRKELTIGNYPDISIAEARRLASIERAAIDGGASPSVNKATRKKAAATKSTEWTVKSLAEDYKLKRLVPSAFAKGTIYYRKADLATLSASKLANRTIASITGQDIVEMLKDAKNTWTVSKRLLTTTSKLFEHAAGLQAVTNNPCATVILTSVFGPRPPIKQRVMLSEDDLHNLLSTMDTLGVENSLSLKVLLATCVRTSELVSARWEDFNFENNSWFVPGPNTKTRRGFHVPLTPTVIQWLDQLKILSAGSPFVLPARTAKKLGQTITNRTLWASIDRAFKTNRLTVIKFTPHDTRSTAKGHLKNMGFTDDITELALSHVVKGVSGIYDVRNEKPEKRKALEAWANFLNRLA